MCNIKYGGGGAGSIGDDEAGVREMFVDKNRYQWAGIIFTSAACQCRGRLVAYQNPESRNQFHQVNGVLPL